MISNGFLHWVMKYEEFNPNPRLSNKGCVQIGFGRNIDEIGISLGEASILLENDLSTILLNLNHFPWFVIQPNFVKDSIVHLCYIFGTLNVLDMDDFKDCLKRLDYKGAARAIFAIESLGMPYERLKDIALVVSEGNRENVPAA
jgi:lysozyme